MNPKRITGLLLAIALFIMLVGQVAASPITQPSVPGTAAAAADKAATWLRAAQQPDGGYGASAKGPSTLSQTTDAIFAFAANGNAPAGVKPVNGQSLTYYLLAHIGTATAPAGVCKAALAAATSLPVGGQSYGGVNVVDKINSYYTNKSLSTTLDYAYCLLAVKQLDLAVPADAAANLAKLQVSDGSFAFAGAGSPGDGDTNTTALAMQALLAGGLPSSDSAMAKAAAYLKTQQNDDGGFPYQKPNQYGTDTDANSTAYVIQGLLAAGVDPTSFKSGTGNDPVAALLKLQNPSGAFRFQGASGDDNLLATLQAIPALRYATQPITPVRSDQGQTYPTPDITSVPAPSPTGSMAMASPTSGMAMSSTPSSTTPGLPRTGNGEATLLLPLLLIFAAISLGLGLRLRRSL